MSHTHNTPANGGQILTEERIDSAWVAVNNGWGIMPRELIRKFARAIEADLRASLAAHAIPTVDRNAVLEEVIVSLSEIHGQKREEGKGISRAINLVMSLMSAAPSSEPQPAVPQEWTKGMLARRWCTGDQAWSQWQLISENDYALRSDDKSFQFNANCTVEDPEAAQPAAQVAVSEDRPCTTTYTKGMVIRDFDAPDGLIVKPAGDTMHPRATPATDKTAEGK